MAATKQTALQVPVPYRNHKAMGFKSGLIMFLNWPENYPTLTSIDKNSNMQASHMVPVPPVCAENPTDGIWRHFPSKSTENTDYERSNRNSKWCVKTSSVPDP